MFDYRNARLAVEWMEEGPEGVAKLQKYPRLVTLVKEMLDAQSLVEIPTRAGGNDVP